MFLMSDKYVVCEVALVFALTRFILSFLLNLLISSPEPPSASCCSASSSSSSSSPNSRKITKNLSLTTFGNIYQEDATAISCAVCLNRLRKKSQVWELCNCRHIFHKHCLERWMASHDTCPLCRASLAATDESFLPPQPPSWAVERMLYLFGDDLLP